MSFIYDKNYSIVKNIETQNDHIKKSDYSKTYYMKPFLESTKPCILPKYIWTYSEKSL